MGPLAALATVLAVGTLVLWALNRWRWRRIPGPFAPPLIGNLVGVVRYGLHNYLDMCRRKYGRVFKMYLGSVPFVVVADPEVARKVNYRLIERGLVAQLSADPSYKDDGDLKGLAASNGDLWRSLRLAWQPAFQSGSLERYSALMDSSAVRLCDQLEAAAAEGRELDIWRALGTMTMGVVGTTAFGIDLHTMDDAGSTAAEQGRRLLKACAFVFSSSSFVNGSAYQPLLLMFPKVQWLVKWLAARLPDRALVELTKARAVVRDVSGGLIADWRARHAAPAALDAPAAAANAGAASLEELQGEAPSLMVNAAPVPAGDGASDSASTASADAAPTGARDQADDDSEGPAAISKPPAGNAKAAAAAAAHGKAAGLGVEPGSFLGLLLGARDRGAKGGARFDDTTIMAQSSTFLLAGYETTANTLCYTVYALACNPAARERLLAEIDGFGRDRQITHADLGAFPYAEACIKESLRLYPPAILTSRKVTRDEGFELMPGVVLPKGLSIFSAPYCYQRDEAYWPRPEEFRPERFLAEGSALAPTTENAWTPFGAGPRMCIGWRFALNEAKIALVRLHQRFTFDLREGQVPLKLHQGITLSPANGVWVTPVARGPAGEAAPAAA